MNELAKNPLVLGALLGFGAVVAFYALAPTIARQVGDVNKGTPYEGFGVIGTLGNGVNRLLGGVPEKIGSAIGGALADASGL